MFPMELRKSGQKPSLQYKSQPWYIAYMGALFESDHAEIGERIRYAEHLIVRRERELFNRLAEPAEQHALNNALHALRALSLCLKSSSRAPIPSGQTSAGRH